MKEIVNFLILMAIVVFCIAIIEVNTADLNGGPGAMTTSDAAVGIGMKVASEY